MRNLASNSTLNCTTPQPLQKDAIKSSTVAAVGVGVGAPLTLLAATLGILLYREKSNGARRGGNEKFEGMRDGSGMIRDGVGEGGQTYASIYDSQQPAMLDSETALKAGSQRRPHELL